MIARRLTPIILSLLAATPLAAQQAGESLDALADRLGLTATDAQPRTEPRTETRAAEPSVTAAVPDPVAPPVTANTDDPAATNTDEDVPNAALALVARTQAWLDAQDITPPPSGRPSDTAFDALFPLPDPAAPALPALPVLPARDDAERTDAEGPDTAIAPCGPGDPQPP